MITQPTYDREIVHADQWRLSRIQLVNWGTFDGIVDIPVSRRGFLVTGGSGSGKSTLIDAISAVLVPSDRLRFNAAAQHEARRGKGRDLVSYIRGAWRTTEDPDLGMVVAQYLRPKATFSIIVLTYSNGMGLCRSLTGLFYLKSGDNNPANVVRLFGVFPEQVVEAQAFIPFLAKGLDKRGIKKEFSSASFFEDHAPFAEMFRPLLGISSMEAQLLLQRTQSAKSLDNLDHLFREFMLVEPDTFAYARTAVEQFADLESAYERVQDVKAQVEALSPLEQLHKQVLTAQAEIASTTSLQRALPSVANQLKIAELEDAQVAAEITLEQAKVANTKATEKYRYALEEFSQANQAMNSADGGRVENLQMLVGHHKQQLAERRKAYANLQKRIESHGGVMPTTVSEFNDLINSAKVSIAEHPANMERLNRDLAQSFVSLDQATNEVSTLQQELEVVAANNSNIDARFLARREAICDEFNIKESELPFAGELIDIVPSESEWEPVIQRLLADFAHELLVPVRYYPAVQNYINRTHWGVRLRFSSIDSSHSYPNPRVHPQSLVRKVDVVDHEFSAWVSHELATRYSYVCVNNPGDLDRLDPHEKGVTRSGLVRQAFRRSDPTSRLQKNDVHALGDRVHYRLGSNNQAKVELLRKHLSGAQTTLKARQNENQLIHSRIAQENAQVQFALSIVDEEWENLDTAIIDEHIESLNQQLEQLTENPDVKTLTENAQQAEQKLQDAQEQMQLCNRNVGAAQHTLDGIQASLAEANAEATIDVDDATFTTVHKLFLRHTRRVTSKNVDKLMTILTNEFSANLKKNNETLNTANNKITIRLTSYIERWPAERADLEATPDFITEALAKLQQLKGERLAEFTNQFRALINDMSTRNLADISHRLRQAQNEIRERIAPVNHSLSSSEFSEGRFLRIDVRDARGEVVTTFQRQLDEAVSGGMNEQNDAEAEQRYHNIATLIKRLGSKEAGDVRWQKAVLDTRRHVSFVGVEVDEDGTVLNTYVDSSVLSGGQAQKLVFFCLAAALRYQLAKPDAQYPSYATVVLDEAFDRADPTYTQRAMNVFDAFGFHMILATPLKLIQTLSQYVGNTVVVSYDESPNELGQVRGRSSISRIDFGKATG